jgi:hypothetical protein
VEVGDPVVPSYACRPAFAYRLHTEVVHEGSVGTVSGVNSRVLVRVGKGMARMRTVAVEESVEHAGPHL